MRRSALLAWTWTAIILFLCWLPRPYVPGQEIGPLVVRFNFDKLVHAGVFAGFSFLWMRALAPRPSAIRMVFLAGLALAVVTELGQENRFVRRDANVADGVADVVGVVLGQLVSRWLRPKAGPTPDADVVA